MKLKYLEKIPTQGNMVRFLFFEPMQTRQKRKNVCQMSAFKQKTLPDKK